MTQKIKAVTAYMTEEGEVFKTLNEAAGKRYARALKEILTPGNSGVFGVKKLLDHSREVERILQAYNADMDALEKDADDREEVNQEYIEMVRGIEHPAQLMDKALQSRNS